jgi:hypothetical protein
MWKSNQDLRQREPSMKACKEDGQSKVAWPKAQNPH